MVTRKKKSNPGVAKKSGTRKKVSPAKDVVSEDAKFRQVDKAFTVPFPIVGIGASAGGLEAFETFFKAMPPDSGIAFVLIVHLDPSHGSILPEILQTKTQMKVRQAMDNMKVLPNHVYIIPPNKEMAILNGALQLLDISRPRGGNLPIDIFFRSLATEQADRSICIILSGTGTDGTLGLRAIKGEAGMVMVQDMGSAKYDGMPRSAINTGLADYILPPEKMPQQLLNYVNHIYCKPPENVTAQGVSTLSALQKIFLLLRTATDHNFSQYKKNTICRRIEKRMHVHQINDINDYVRYLRNSDNEIISLFKELLIGVTNFFRDPEAFDLLRDKYLTDLLMNKPDDYPIRIWVPGCSSGEEAYSIAIIVQECMEKINRYFNVQIFGTDIDEEAINKARTGIYPESISVDVNQERLGKYFTLEENQYRIKKTIRELVVFASQNIIKDPPFTKLDLLCCRNLLIYFEPELQRKLLPIFHYSLKRDGILFLGTSESIGQFTDLFAMQEKKWKIFRRMAIETTPHPILSFQTPQPTVEMQERGGREQLRKTRKIDTLHLLKSILSQSNLPASVIIDEMANIIYIHGRTGRFLEPAEGEISINILKMARSGLKAALTSAIRRLATNELETYRKKVQVKEGTGSFINVNLVVRPLPESQTGVRGLLLVTLEEVDSAEEKLGSGKGQQRGKKKNADLKRLEDELQFTKDSLQTTIEDLETSNEELKSLNEELQSTNEELQSTNEELETSKEELQSLNEESATVNAELQSRIDELSKSNDDIKNLLAATQIATIFLDTDLKINRFTPKVTDIVPLTGSDIGRPINHFSSKLQDINLFEYARQVLDDLVFKDIEVASKDDKYFRLRIIPYRTTTNVIEGVVITFDDITELKKKKEEFIQFNKKIRRMVAVVKDSNDAITLQDFKGNIIAWNKGATIMYGYSEKEALQMNVKDLVPPEKRKEALALLAELEQREIKSVETQRKTKDGRIIDVWLTVTRLIDDNGEVEGIATTERDISGYKQT